MLNKGSGRCKDCHASAQDKDKQALKMVPGFLQWWVVRPCITKRGSSYWYFGYFVAAGWTNCKNLTRRVLTSVWQNLVEFRSLRTRLWMVRRQKFELLQNLIDWVADGCIHKWLVCSFVQFAHFAWIVSFGDVWNPSHLTSWVCKYFFILECNLNVMFFVSSITRAWLQLD